MSLRFYTAAERPELRERLSALVAAWPEFMLEDPVSARCFGLLYERFPTMQHFLVDMETDELLAEVNSVPVAVDLDDLPDRGWDDVLERGTSGKERPTCVSAIQVLVHPERHGRGLSTLCLSRMREAVGEHGFADLVAPVRPSWKDRYPLVPIDRYVTWTTKEGLPFDPWLRVHARLGAELVRPCPESMTITGSVSDWEKWSGMAFPESGDYVVPGALELVTIDRAADLGTYVEPNVWMRHRL
jgi:GNAT superfamily N-acetyltransferase